MHWMPCSLFLEDESTDVDMDLPEDIQASWAWFLKVCKKHVLPPVNVGAKHASLWHESTVKYHSLRLQVLSLCVLIQYVSHSDGLSVNILQSV